MTAMYDEGWGDPWGSDDRRDGFDDRSSGGQPDGSELLEYEFVTVVAVTEKAVLVTLSRKLLPQWIPKSLSRELRAVRPGDQAGKFYIPRWLAVRKGL